MGKTILILAGNDVGLYNFRAELLIELLAAGYDVWFSSPTGERVADLIKLGCRYMETDLERRGTNPLKDLQLYYRYRRMLRQIKPDLVITYTIKPVIYGGLACKALHIPYITNITGLGTALETSGGLQTLLLVLLRSALWHTNILFFQNQDNVAFYQTHGLIHAPYCLVAGSGVNLDRFPLLPYPDDKVIRFLFIARIMKAKGIDQYLEAAAVIHTKYPQTEFHILGACDEDYSGRLKDLDNAGIIHYHGQVRDVSEYLYMSHCTIHPTYYPEGMSNVLLESAASGRPIITTDRPGCKEILKDGVNGFLVKVQDSIDLIAKIEYFLSLSNEQRCAMGIAGRKKVEQEFDRKQVTEAYLNAIKSYCVAIK